MSVTYGFFNSIDGDRVYNADQMSTYFKGLIGQGVYEDVGGALQVLADTGMTVKVQTGRAIIDYKWLENDAVESVQINTASAVLPRYTAVVVRLDVANRLIEFGTVDGTAASSPSYPAMTNTTTIKEICLAMVYVAAGATSITQANITDTRPSALCGWVTGLIKQVNTSTLWLQWQAAYQAYYDAMTEQFQEWFDSLTQQLNINTFIKHFDWHYYLPASTTGFYLRQQGYTYSESDIINVYINGLYAVNGVDYTLSVSGGEATITGLPSGTEKVVDVQVLRSQIGFYVITTGTNEALATDNDDMIMA